MSRLRYCRQELFSGLGEEGQEKLERSAVVIAGCGALGSLSSSLLVRAGVGRVRVVDRDYVEVENLQRQTLFTDEQAGRRLPKAIAAGETLRAANPDVVVETETADINPRTVGKLLGGFDLVVDALDNMETRFLVNDFCLKNKVPWIYGAAVGSTGMVMSVSPAGKPCLRCLVPQFPGPGSFGTCDTVGIVGPVPAVSASIQAAEALKVLAGRPEASKKLVVFDLWQRNFEEIEVRPNPECSSCAKGLFDALDSKDAAQATRLCGRNSVEIMPEKETNLNLRKMEQSLSGMGKVQYNGYSLWFDTGRLEMVIFADGRIIVKGTDDPAEARAAYGKFIGS